MPVIGNMYDGVQGGRFEVGTATSSDPASIGAGATGTATLAIANLDSTDLLWFTNSTPLAGLVVVGVSATAPGVATVQLFNPTAGALDAAAAGFGYLLFKTNDQTP